MDILSAKDLIIEVLEILNRITYNDIKRIELNDLTVFVEINGQLSNSEKELFKESLISYNIQFSLNSSTITTCIFIDID